MDVLSWWRSHHNLIGSTHTERIKAFAWFLQSIAGQPDFSATEIRNCFVASNLEPPQVSSHLRALGEKRPKEVLRSGDRFKLEFASHAALSEKFGHRQAAIHVHKLLTELPARIQEEADRAFLEECLTCFRNRAFRASVVMAWNLAYDHLCIWVLKDPTRLSSFNATFPIRYPKEKFTPIVRRDEFTEWKESQVIAVCNSAGIISGSVNKILEEKLKRRNLAAHPSGTVTSEPTAEEFIKDIVENVVLKLD